VNAAEHDDLGVSFGGLLREAERVPHVPSGDCVTVVASDFAVPSLLVVVLLLLEISRSHPASTNGRTSTAAILNSTFVRFFMVFFLALTLLSGPCLMSPRRYGAAMGKMASGDLST
jgi:hypothetical protein